MGAHDDEIGIALPSDPEDRVCRVPGSDLDVPRVAERIRDEIVESRQRFLVVILEYSHRFR
jgi:hypothetical protein